MFEKNLASFPSISARISMFEHFRGDWAYAKPNFFWEISKNFFFQNLYFGPIRWVPRRFFKILIFLSAKFAFYLGIFESFSKIIACVCWAYAETILSNAEHTRNRFHRMLSKQGTKFLACSASGKIWTFLHVQSMLSIRGTNFIAHWAYWELISSHAEHTRNRFHHMLSMRWNV